MAAVTKAGVKRPTWPARLALLWALAGVTSLAWASWFTDDKPSVVQDLRYGAALYEYYQNKNLEALSELLVAEARGGIVGHGDNPEIMTGGFYLAYGMPAQAEAIFNRLLDANRPLATRNAAWFYLARLAYLNDAYPRAISLLNKLETPSHALQVEADVLRFNIAAREGQLRVARGLMNQSHLQNSDWQPYLRYNYAAALGRVQNWQASADEFARLTNMRERSDEHLGLYDKAMTAEGYSRLFAEDYVGAMAGFSKVRLDSPLANRALLGYGWAAFELEDYGRALKPWQVLAERVPVDENIQEVWIAVPTAYERMGFASAALEHYQSAASAYETEIQKLDDTLTSLKGNAIRAALAIDRSADFSWLDYAAASALTPELTYLVRLFAEDRFLKQVQELRDLLAIQTNLLNWQTKLDHYSQMLVEREANRSQDVARLVAQNLDARIAELVSARHEFGTRLHELQSAPDYLQLVALDQVKKRNRLQAAQANWRLLDNAGPAADEAIAADELAALGEALRIHQGLLVWDSAAMNDERMARARQALSAVSAQLDAVRASKARIEAIIAEGFDLAPYRAAIDDADQKLAFQTTSIEIAINRAQDRLRARVAAALTEERERLLRYLGQSRLAIARLLDSAANEAVPAATQPEGQDV